MYDAVDMCMNIVVHPPGLTTKALVLAYAVGNLIVQFG